MNIEDLVFLDPLGRILSGVMHDERWLVLEAKLIVGGKSNLTFEVSSEVGTVILRRPPTGTLLPSAHDMLREARVQSALASTPIPVAEVLHVESSGETLGVPYYIMEKVEGHVIRDQLPDGLYETADKKYDLGNALVDVLLLLHSVNPASIGLGDFGRTDGYLERQINRWIGQWEKSKTHDVAAIDELGARLNKFIPDSSRSSIVHGDYRIDNCIMSDGHSPQVKAVLDWELSSLGDPMVDLALMLFYWREPGDRELALIPSVTAMSDFPKRAHLMNRYADATDLPFDNLWFYEAFARFKFAVITQGVLARVTSGAMAGQEFGDLDEEVRELAEEGLERLRRKG
jgi:aminoglycoside phosphotransferase (APT) family kinase protein